MRSQAFRATTLAIVASDLPTSSHYIGTQQTIPTCRTISGDLGWPGVDDWDILNKTVNGRLIKTVPIIAPCHELFSGPGVNVSVYNESRCAVLRDRWYLPETHISYPSSPMAYPITNNSCSPFTEPDVPCTMGYYVAYTINATDASAVQEALRFAREHNTRLVNRNSGHDYLGKSTGAYDLEVWVHHMKSISLIKNYSNFGYR